MKYLVDKTIKFLKSHKVSEVESLGMSNQITVAENILCPHFNPHSMAQVAACHLSFPGVQGSEYTKHRVNSCIIVY